MPIEAWRMSAVNFMRRRTKIEQMVQEVRARVSRGQVLLEAVADWKVAGSPRTPQPGRDGSPVLEERAPRNVKKIVEVAAGATKTISNKVDEALRALSSFDGRAGNGYGIFSNPFLRRAELARAKATLDAAWEEMNKTSWPNNRDHDAHEG